MSERIRARSPGPGPVEAIVPTTVRLTGDVHATLERHARRMNMSTNAFITSLLEDTLRVMDTIEHDPKRREESFKEPKVVSILRLYVAEPEHIMLRPGQSSPHQK